MIESLFPCPIGHYELDRELSKDEMGYLKNIPMERNTGNDVSVRGDILHNDRMIELTKFIGNSLEEFCKETWDFNTDKVQLYVTQSWTNRTKKGEYHHAHVHQNSIVSGVFYFDGNDDDVIEFIDNKAWLGGKQWAVEAKEDTSYNAERWWYPADVGTLLLFPSSLEHSVPEVEGDKDRYSISFNTFFKGAIGNSTERTELIL